MFELIINCAADNSEILSEALLELGALSVSLEDANLGTEQEEEIYGEPGMEPQQSWQQGRLNALFNNQQQAQQAWQQLQHSFTLAASQASFQEVEEQDWVRLTQSQFQPIAINDDFWIVPSWSAIPTQAKTVISLDPGLAFGTGSHPTTKMCLRWLAKHIQVQDTVLDYGCGSGILAIAASKLGANQVTGVDIDEQAVQAAQANAQHNQVKLKLGLPDMASGQYSLVVANILANPLKVLAPLLSQLVASNGHLVLAGILSRQAQELQQAYANYLKLTVADEEDGWILMTAQRK